jgi:hypothetical protein
MKISVPVPAKPNGVWTFVDSIWTTPVRIVFEAQNQRWKYAPAHECTADGDLQSLIDPARAILGAGPVGALIAKVGGSSAGVSDGVCLFLVGQYCAVETKPEWKGPLYLTINDEVKGFENNGGSIVVDVTIESI